MPNREDQPVTRFQAKSGCRGNCTKMVRLISYQVIMEPISGALLGFVKNEFNKHSLKRRCRPIQAVWPFREEFSLCYYVERIMSNENQD